MNREIAFYYHIPVSRKGNELFVPSYLGVFLDELASRVKTLYLIMHEEVNRKEADYKLRSLNISFVTLGAKAPAWHRMIFYRKILQKKLQTIQHVDFLLVRSPTPLSPFFNKFFPEEKLVYMIVGDYMDGAKQIKVNSIRSALIIVLLWVNDLWFRAQMKRSLVLVNSPALYEKYKDISKLIEQIRTTTLSSGDFYERMDTCSGKLIKLLFTGRFDPAKGLYELVRSLSELNREAILFQLDLVGWESDPLEPVKNDLIKLAKQLGVSDNVFFHKKLSVGDELNTMYRKADIYIIPSYHEGFPRTIWEAMANSCPVIATKVGSIPHFLEQGFHALLIDPKSVEQIVGAVREMAENIDLRMQLIGNGYKLAQMNTLEFQTSELLNKIYNHYEK